MPTFQIPQIAEYMTESEITDALAIYIMAFGKLNYQITIKALSKMMLDETKMKEFRQLPIPTLARESVKLTEFTEQEKENYRLSQNVEYFHDPLHKGVMYACNASTWKSMPEYDRPMTPLEEDYYDNQLMSSEEYNWWKWGKDKGKPKPKTMRYDPATRTNNFVEYQTKIDDFIPLDEGK